MVSRTELHVRIVEHNRRIEAVNRQGWLRSFDNKPCNQRGIAALVSGTLRGLRIRRPAAGPARPLTAQQA